MNIILALVIILKKKALLQIWKFLEVRVRDLNSGPASTTISLNLFIYQINE